MGPHLTQCRLSETYLRTKWHHDSSNPLTTIHQCYRQTGQTGQWSRSIGLTVTCNGRPETKATLIVPQGLYGPVWSPCH